ncbi:4a-hydroxytetrahydrobiopterin dehydratase [Candidatus Roizmanbacteria bacterium RIFCSPHIGHO2_01_FULL_39_8]|uniref:Putative pterin-4-alpha-carbinolamine dehydratase n=3 Tax=Candidatus Roizmaniibacteriota TaxID=1752723 RepID=A0A1F7GRW4_9BACT|nr:MAG: 4a-hydroxytetrahydrobiopterin dehydratase [Candidatus Roizmanbacteria bacterium RIFCSPHIGHO2_01_FULL_39_8]OGK25648.1 MAG: 4a-hydroxytetrahydrobiopterin dehydratase [Candidatus Roizmanbacteria bacterium RIFCSPHIGHO2_02_FULL_39_9]OGK36172.1 MAG: 4a-hydroxytetrahydrobiopterin dehydratase [Candidatus Roizmanbacteria bacterium RIFCSPHIGHO2_12_FULL_39_8]
MNDDLLNQKCEPCEGGVPPMTKDEIKHYLPKLKEQWELIEDKKISHTFKLKTFRDAIAFVNKIADLAEKEGHHPNIHLLYNKVKIVLSTHAIDGLSRNDFILAAKIEKLL